VTFVTAAGADLFRYTPVFPHDMAVDFYSTEDLSGPVVVSEVSPNSEAMWNDRTPAGLTWGEYSARARFEYVADADGVHQFSLISAGRSRLMLNGELVADAWTNWRRGDTYFTFGCDEVVHQRTMKAGERLQVVAEFTTAGVPKTFYGLRVGAARLLDHSDVDAAVAAARDADVAIVFAGLNAEWDNEGLDRPGIELPHRQNELVQRVREANPNTVVVLQSGSPLALPWLANVKAVLQAWYPGQECGNAIADVMLGRSEPGGRLPQTWPQRIEDSVAYGVDSEYPGVDGEVNYAEGVFIGYRHYEAHGYTPMFPFGHGLSYTRFDISALRLDRSTLNPGETLTATVMVRNVGERAGSEVVQLYVSDVGATLSRPPQELKAFAKVHLQPGEQREVSLTLDMRAFAAFDPSRASWWAEAGEFEIRVGRSSAERAVSARVHLAADWLEPARRQG
jgi:beta-glucosidase